MESGTNDNYGGSAQQERFNTTVLDTSHSARDHDHARMLVGPEPAAGAGGNATIAPTDDRTCVVASSNSANDVDARRSHGTRSVDEHVIAVRPMRSNSTSTTATSTSTSTNTTTNKSPSSSSSKMIVTATSNADDHDESQWKNGQHQRNSNSIQEHLYDKSQGEQGRRAGGQDDKEEEVEVEATSGLDTRAAGTANNHVPHCNSTEMFPPCSNGSNPSSRMTHMGGVMVDNNYLPRYNHPQPHPHHVQQYNGPGPVPSSGFNHGPMIRRAPFYTTYNPNHGAMATVLPPSNHPNHATATQKLQQGGQYAHAYSSQQKHHPHVMRMSPAINRSRHMNGAHQGYPPLANGLSSDDHVANNHREMVAATGGAGYLPAGSYRTFMVGSSNVKPNPCQSDQPQQDDWNQNNESIQHPPFHYYCHPPPPTAMTTGTQHPHPRPIPMSSTHPHYQHLMSEQEYDQHHYHHHMQQQQDHHHERSLPHAPSRTSIVGPVSDNIMSSNTFVQRHTTQHDPSLSVEQKHESDNTPKRHVLESDPYHSGNVQPNVGSCSTSSTTATLSPSSKSPPQPGVTALSVQSTQSKTLHLSRENVAMDVNSPDRKNYANISMSRAGGVQPPVACNDDPSNMQIGCTCKKSKCLKLYCQCFAAKSMCQEKCRCQDCKNDIAHTEQRTHAIQTILSRNPQAFDTKFKAILPNEVHTDSGANDCNGSGNVDAFEIGTKGLGPDVTMNGSGENVAVAHKTGCKCRRSACLKKYCECFNAGVKCSTKCRCVGCKNVSAAGSGDEDHDGASLDVVRLGVEHGAKLKVRAKQKLSKQFPIVDKTDSIARSRTSCEEDTAYHHVLSDDTYGSHTNVMDAAQNLAFLKNMTPVRPINPTASTRKALLDSNSSTQRTTKNYTGAHVVPSLTTSDVTDRDDEASDCERGVTNNNFDTNPASSSHDAVLMAAYAMAELCGTPSRPIDESLRSSLTSKWSTPTTTTESTITNTTPNHTIHSSRHGQYDTKNQTHTNDRKRGRSEDSKVDEVDNRFETPKTVFSSSRMTKANPGTQRLQQPSNNAITPTLASEGETPERKKAKHVDLPSPASIPKLNRSIGVCETLSAQLYGEIQK